MDVQAVVGLFILGVLTFVFTNALVFDVKAYHHLFISKKKDLDFINQIPRNLRIRWVLTVNIIANIAGLVIMGITFNVILS